MFAVPGWSVSTSDLKPQKEASAAKPPTATAAADVKHAPYNHGKESQQKPNKRKRDQNGKNGTVTKSNLNEMFRRHIEGHTGDNNARKKKKKNKEQKGADGMKPENKNNGEEEKSQAKVEESRPSKKQKKSIRPEKKSHDKSLEDATTTVAISEAVQPTPPPPAPPAGSKLTPLQQKMRDKLMSARFRHLNETLYTTPSEKAFEMFTANPELFAEYHAGFTRQVQESWPSNPVDGYIAAVKKRGAVLAHRHSNKSGPNQPAALPRRPNGMCTIIDLGCGDAQLARALTPSAKKLQLKLLSYDLHAPDPLITKADIANLPLADGSVDIAVFCLSLMGTNWISFVEEAYRVLRGDGKGECWVSEVKSRFGRVTRKKAQIGLKKPESNTQKKKNKKKKAGKGGESEEELDDEDDIYAENAQQNNQSNANDETDTSAFVEVFKSRGFVLKQESVEKSNKMFIKMEFVKAGGAPTKGRYAGVTPSGKPTAVQTKKKFIDRDVDVKELTVEEEAKVLKPCVYKIR
ncbi:methyltransferase-domain-containing protein [Talaromyces proteolyticus]|uniref:Ribosomal RNA-processing protein 8 n=1 Tax=Talaromyces proteolyticus TaxID=1131652 RepID=A0AAD4KGR1_9EURO|nr:methyltransferase-domain-containing protein [Talaromyces proteolyticus]KAH8691421.1 methyltransferase-domain-containing protein [Talaromyces proteolyticus]